MWRSGLGPLQYYMGEKLTTGMLPNKCQPSPKGVCVSGQASRAALLLKFL